MPNRKLQVFISSTFLDLVDERQAAVAAILKAGHIPAGMELFTAGDESQWQTITRWIDESDVYMIILGGRYGSTHPESGVGYTEMEYDYAVAQKKPFFAVVINEAALDERVKSRGKEVLELKHPEKLKDFRQKVLSRTSTFFSDVKDIRLAIHETIPVLDQRHTLAGWISGSEFTSNKPLIDELAKLGEENRLLRGELASLQKQLAKIPSKTQEQEFQELQEVLLAKEIDVRAIKGDKKDAPDKVSLLQIFYAQKDAIAAGVTNQLGTSDFENFLYFTVCPALEVHELVESEKVASVRWRRYKLTTRGKKFLAYVETEILKRKREKKKK